MYLPGTGRRQDLKAHEAASHDMSQKGPIAPVNMPLFLTGYEVLYKLQEK